MNRYLFGVLSILVALCASAFSQTNESPSPAPAATPKPMVKRRGLDQFGLSGGVFNSSVSEAPAGNDNAQTVAEPVDSKLGDLLLSVGYHFQGLETGYRQAYEKRKDPRYGGLMPEKYVFDGLVGNFASATGLREGRFEGQPFKNSSNAALFEDLRITVDDLTTATSRMQRDYYTNAGSTAMGLVEKYSVPTFENEVGQSMFLTRNLVLAILTRVRGDIARLEKQIIIVR